MRTFLISCLLLVICLKTVTFADDNEKIGEWPRRELPRNWSNPDDEGVKYIPPHERSGLWWKIIPTVEDIPDRKYGFQYELLEFEGCEFYRDVWGTGRNSEIIVTYWAQFRLRSGFPEKLVGNEGDWRLCVLITSLNSTSNNGWPGNSVMVGLGFRRTF